MTFATDTIRLAALRLQALEAALASGFHGPVYWATPDVDADDFLAELLGDNAPAGDERWRVAALEAAIGAAAAELRAAEAAHHAAFRVSMDAYLAARQREVEAKRRAAWGAGR